ncbi:MAG: GNAT family N-acetyltransferase, partial [Pseudomonadota bacterium]
LDGVAVQPMIHRPQAHELILGIADDVVFGPVILFGAGGTSVEAVRDKAVSLPPLDLTLAHDLIAETRISRLLNGYRKRPAADRDTIALCLVRLSQLAADFPEVSELDINPLLADHEGVIALDARVAIGDAEPAAAGSNPRFSLRPYPSNWEQTHDVRGRALIIRPVRPEDEPNYADFLGALSTEDMRLRFLGLMMKPTHSIVARFTQIDYAREMAFVAVDPGTKDIVGVSRMVADPDYAHAEFALVTRSDQKRQGIGRALMKVLISYAESEGIERLTGDVLRRNTGMLSLCKELGFKEHHIDDDLKLVRLERTTKT